MINYQNKIVQEDMQEILKDIEVNSLKDKTILITGATGMLATYLVYFLNYLNITESLNTYIQKDYVYDTNFFTQELETFTCISFLSDGSKILKPSKLKMFPYFKKEDL